jgi:hypothetical protein
MDCKIRRRRACAEPGWTMGGVVVGGVVVGGGVGLVMMSPVNFSSSFCILHFFVQICKNDA